MAYRDRLGRIAGRPVDIGRRRNVGPGDRRVSPVRGLPATGDRVDTIDNVVVHLGSSVSRGGIAVCAGTRGRGIRIVSGAGAWSGCEAAEEKHECGSELVGVVRRRFDTGRLRVRRAVCRRNLLIGGANPERERHISVSNHRAVTTGTEDAPHKRDNLEPDQPRGGMIRSISPYS